MQLSVRGLTKTFGPHRGIFEVDLDVQRGEIVALVGENGAGKTTLVRCISGMTPADRGTIELIPGESVAVVWQDLALCDNLDAVANIFLGAELGRVRRQDDRMRRAAERLLEDIGVRIADLDVPVRQLSGGQRQMVAVARALRTGARILVLDEPTAALGVVEARALEALLVRPATAGWPC
ncbi:MAG: ATP-binding cassette domain-containing protein [Ilumatobacteraceae bacterium]